jgi:hypothetical protein
MKDISSKPFFFTVEEPAYTPDKGVTRQFVDYGKDIMRQ